MGSKPRRDEYAEATRAALLDAARSLFSERGFADASVEEIARVARVTKGALYHHFAGKKELFVEVFDELHRELMAEVVRKADERPDPWSRLVGGVEAFLDGCMQPDFQRIALQEAPAVLGWDRWRERDEGYSLGVVRATLETLIEAGEIDPQPVDLLARILLGALSEAARTIASAADERSARAEAGALLLRFLGSLRAKPRTR